MEVCPRGSGVGRRFFVLATPRVVGHVPGLAFGSLLVEEAWRWISPFGFGNRGAGLPSLFDATARRLSELEILVQPNRGASHAVCPCVFDWLRVWLGVNQVLETGCVDVCMHVCVCIHTQMNVCLISWLSACLAHDFHDGVCVCMCNGLKASPFVQHCVRHSQNQGVKRWGGQALGCVRWHVRRRHSGRDQ